MGSLEEGFLRQWDRRGGGEEEGEEEESLFFNGQFSNLGSKPASELPASIWSAIRSFNFGQAYQNYHARYIAPGRSAAPLWHLVGTVLVIGYALNIPSNIHHKHEEQQEKLP